MFSANLNLLRRSETTRWKMRQMRTRYHTNPRKHEALMSTPSGLKASGFDFPIARRQMVQRHKDKGPGGAAWTQNPLLAHFEAPMSRSNRGALPYSSLQGRGDAESLTSSMVSVENEKNRQLYGKDAWKHTEEPLPYTPLMAQRLRRGNLWPKAPDEKIDVKTLMTLKNDEDMTYRASNYAFKVEYWLRRDFKSMPGVLGDMFNFEQFILVKVICSQKRRNMYIVWSTVHPGARYEIEPILTQLRPWIYRRIKQRIKKHTAPMLPEITWVYESQESTQIEIPRRVKQEINESMNEHFNVQLQEKVDHIKQMGTMEARLSRTPWYMPYLWAKEERREKKKSRAEYEENAKGATKFLGNQTSSDGVLREMMRLAQQIT